MSKKTKIWLIAAASLMVIGGIIIAAVLANHWKFSDLSTNKYETNTYEITEEFRSIAISTYTADIVFAASGDGACRVVCYEEENMKHSVSVQDDTLTVNTVDDRAWYEHIGFGFKSPKVTVYLPEAEYASLNITGSTGDIRISDISAGALDLTSSTGDIFISDVTCAGDMKARVSTGDVHVTGLTCQSLTSRGSTGDIFLKDVIAAGKLSVERSTGDVVFRSSDAADICVETSTGDVSGSLLTEKIFLAESSTGDVNVPKTAAGGKCEITTSTGDITIDVAGKS